MSALLQLYLHSWLDPWFRWIVRRQLQDEAKNCKFRDSVRLILDIWRWFCFLVLRSCQPHIKYGQWPWWLGLLASNPMSRDQQWPTVALTATITPGTIYVSMDCNRCQIKRYVITSISRSCLVEVSTATNSIVQTYTIVYIVFVVDLTPLPVAPIVQVFVLSLVMLWIFSYSGDWRKFHHTGNLKKLLYGSWISACPWR